MATRTLSGILVLAVLVWTATPSGAQSRATTGDVTGVVIDQTGAVLQEAALTVVHLDTGIPRTATTGADGRFAVRGLSPGVYRITAMHAGFDARTLEAIEVPLGVVVEVTIALALAGVGADVEVRADAPLVDPRRTVVSTVISRAQIDHLPIDGRDFLSFSLLSPGVSADRTPQQGASATSGLTFAGQRARANNIMVDGLDNNDAAIGSVRAGFSQDAVAEFQVLASSYAAEFGRASGGIVNIVTRSGGNRLAGTSFLFLRDDALNAKEHFERFTPAGGRIDRSKAPYAQRQFGATLGGPLRRDRTFYFLSFERLEIDASQFVTIDDETIVLVAGTPIGTPAGILRSAGFPIETGNVPSTVRSSQLLGKIDEHVGPGHRLGVRMNWARIFDEHIEPWGGLVARSRGASLESHDVMLALSHTAVLSPRAINEIRSQIAYRDQNVVSLDPTCGAACDREDLGGPTVEVVGVASVGRQRFTPAPRETLLYQVLDTVSLERGSHLLKGGADYRHVRHPSGALPLHFGGRYIFTALPAIPGVTAQPVSSIQAVALGLPAAYVQGYGRSASQYAVHDLALFVQDEWRVSSDLTINAGVRYQNQIWPDLRFDVRDLGSFAFPSDHDNVAPRIAAAWTPGSTGRWSMHAAYGVYYDAQLTGFAGIADILDGTSEGVRTLVLPFPGAATAWRAPDRRLPEAAVGPFPSLAVTMDPRLATAYAHHTIVGVTRQLPGRASLSADLIHVRGHNQVGTIDFNPLVPALGPGRRPGDALVNGVPAAGTSASVLQYTSYGETWYRGLAVSLSRRFDGRFEWLASYTLSKAEDNTTDYQSAFVPQDMGRGRNPDDPFGLPIGFDPDAERGPSLQDQRHRLALSGAYVLPGDVLVSSIVTVGSGRPYNILAGLDLNGNGDAGAFPSDRARAVPADPTTSLRRNSGTLPMQATVDVRASRRFPLGGRASVEGIVEMFNVLNRTNVLDLNTVFGPGAYPSAPLPTFGQIDRTGPPRQAQLGLRIAF